VIGLTNRRDLIDPALLRPGRLEVHLPVEPPGAAGRLDILRIHLRRLRETARLDPAVWDALPALSTASGPTEGWTGAELAGLCRSACSFALQRALDLAEAEAAGAGAGAGAGAAAARVRVEPQDLEVPRPRTPCPPPRAPRPAPGERALD
jgi:SpoVK/Ycf46/Vps4 family AAA+-type ATPase